MTEAPFLERNLATPLDDLEKLPPDQRAAAVREAVPDLHFFLDEGRDVEARGQPARTLALAISLRDALTRSGVAAPALRERIVTDALLRAEADRDQNVYLGTLFTRVLTRAVPDVIFQPANLPEASAALRWARDEGVPVTLRGAASTAMGGSVPNDGGLTLDLSRLDMVDVDTADGVCVVGAGARLRTVHARLAARGRALPAYPSNLGGTLVGWFVTGGIGLNAFGRGRALDGVRAADVLLPSGDHVRFHDDGRLDVPHEGGHRVLSGEEAAGWFRERGWAPMTLADLAGSEGVLGLVLQLTMRIEPLPVVHPFLLAFERRDDAFAAVAWIERGVGERIGIPANVKLFSASHMHHVRRVWAEEDARPWRAAPGAIATDAQLPWRRTVGPEELGVACSPDGPGSAAYLFVDFLDASAARAFVAALPECPGAPRVLGSESVRVAAERFKPQQTKRLGPGLLAAEIVLPSAEVPRFLPRAERMARNAGRSLDAEIYYLADGSALLIGAYFVDHRTAAVAFDLVLAPAMMDLAQRAHRGHPYVLGRWQASYLERTVGAGGAKRLRTMKAALDPRRLVSPGVKLALELRGTLGMVAAAALMPGVGIARAAFGIGWLRPAVALVRAAFARFPGPAARGGAAAPDARVPEDRAIHCVNCGECNSVCPIFSESKIRLPQALTHIGEAMRGGTTPGATAGALLDLCMRCGNCEEVCQAGIPHLPLYERMQTASDEARPRDRDRHVAIVAAVRGSNRYLREFLNVRPGAYAQRSPASLPGLTRYLVLRAEGDEGPAETCIHCGACVPVCPTEANREFEDADPRRITTVQDRCIGCGTCVEVCPANDLNGGRTLRVMEAPTIEWLDAVAAYERGADR